MESSQSLLAELRVVLDSPELPRARRNDPGLDKKWRAGDLALRVPACDFERVAEELGLTVSLLKSYAQVARAYPPEERTVRAAWTVYREARHTVAEDRSKVLWDGQTLRGIRRALGKGDMDLPKRDRQPIEQRAWAVIEELQHQGVRELVMQEMASSVTDRKARRAATTTLGEIGARRRFIEAELRRLSHEPSPERQFWQASKELNESARFVFSIARLHSQHRDSMDEGRWKEIVATLHELADAASVVADRIAGLAEADLIEIEDEDEFPALMPGRVEDAKVVGDDD